MIKTGEQQFYDGLRWIINHPDEFKELQRVCIAAEEARNLDGSKRFHSITRQGIYTLAQLMGVRVTNMKTFQRDNSLWSTLSRYLLVLHPQLERVIETRECEVARYIRAHGLPALESEYI